MHAPRVTQLIVKRLVVGTRLIAPGDQTSEGFGKLLRPFIRLGELLYQGQKQSAESIESLRGVFKVSGNDSLHVPLDPPLAVVAVVHLR